MTTKFVLKDIIKKLAENLNTKATLDNKFELEYILPNVTEEQLLEQGFEYVGKSQYTNYPMYRKENLEALFLDSVLHIYEVTV